MTTTLDIPVLPVSDDVPTQHRFDLDDAFSVDDASSASGAFDFGAGASFLKELQLRPSIGAEEEEDVEDMQEQASFDSTDASVSTLDMHNDAATPPHTPPQPSSSSYSLNSDAQPRTPPDGAPPSPMATHMFTDIALSPPSSTHDAPLEQHAYPNVVIDASKTARAPTFSSAVSHASSRSSTSEYAADAGGSAHAASTSGHTPSPSVSISKSSGPSVLQKVVSKTRPPHLPPKEKQEDEKHNKEWEEMMERSRVAERKRQEALEARRLARELSVEANTSLWQRAVLPDWKSAVKNPELRKLWWDGVPTKLRSTVWERAVGNGLALSRDAYSSTLARAKNLLATQRFPSKTLSQIDADVARTLPELHIFHHLTGPLYGDLRDLLCAWVVSRADEGLGYVEGIARIGAMLLLNLTGPAQAFVVMRNLLETGCLRAFYGGPGTKDDVEAYYRIFDTLLADGMPKVYFNFKQHQISPAAYLPDWLLPLFLDHLPLEACSRIWDVLLLEGDAFLFRAALAMLACLESRLFFPDRAELLAVLKGESSAALQVTLRQSPINGENGVVGPRYEIYGINEETLWERVVEMEEWFKESTWRRLTQRELPDL